MFHITDWLPTFANLAGVTVESTSVDGKDIWPALSYTLNSPRENVLCHLDYVYGIKSYIRGDYKYVNGTTDDGIYDRWMDNIDENETHQSFAKYGESILNSTVGQALARYSLSELNPLAIDRRRQGSVITCNDVLMPIESQFQCRPLESPCLFNIIDDPCERKNIALLRPVMLRSMEMEINKYERTAKAVRNKPSDERANPANFDNTWTWWFDELGIPDHKENSASCSSLVSSVFVIVSLNVLSRFI